MHTFRSTAAWPFGALSFTGLKVLGDLNVLVAQLWVRERTLEKGKARLQSAGVEPDFNRDPVTRQPLAFSTAAPEPPPRPRRQGDGRFNSALP